MNPYEQWIRDWQAEVAARKAERFLPAWLQMRRMLRRMRSRLA